MTMHEEWTDRLSDYLDGELSNDERAAVDAHLGQCRECAAALNDLKRVVAQAQTLAPRPPDADLWRGIAGRLDEAAGGHVMAFAPKRSRTIALTLPQLAAAAALGAAVSGGVVWTWAGRSPEGLRHAATPAGVAPAGVAQGLSPADHVETVGLADAQYDAAVSDLEKALKDGRGHLDASTIAIVEHNLQTIDMAIEQARQALVTDPGNTYLSGHLVEARRRKLDLLRRTLSSETD